MIRAKRSASVNTRMSPTMTTTRSFTSGGLRRTLESAQHDDNASVLSHMRDRLGAASHVVQVRNGLGANHAKSVQALGRDIDVPRLVKWRRAYKKHVLCLDKGSKVGVDVRVHLAHDKLLKESRDSRTVWQTPRIGCGRIS